VIITFIYLFLRCEKGCRNAEALSDLRDQRGHQERRGDRPQQQNSNSSKTGRSPPVARGFAGPAGTRTLNSKFQGYNVKHGPLGHQAPLQDAITAPNTSHLELSPKHLGAKACLVSM